LLLPLLCLGAVLAQAEALRCMFFGFPGLKYDGVDRTNELNEKTFNKTVFAKGAKSVVLFSDVEADDDELEQYECYLQVIFLVRQSCP